MTFAFGVMILVWLVVGFIFLLDTLQIIKKLKAEKDEDAMVQVKFFKTTINENKGFYESLSTKEKAEFNQLFVLEHPKHLVKGLRYQPQADNAEFFQTVFNFIFRYRKIISLNLLKKLHLELVRLARNDVNTVVLLNEAMIRTTYARRKDQAFFNEAFAVAKGDVALQKTKLNPRNQYVYSFIRLAIIFEKTKRYQEALVIVEEALSRNLADKTMGGYVKRKERILSKMKA